MVDEPLCLDWSAKVNPFFCVQRWRGDYKAEGKGGKFVTKFGKFGTRRGGVTKFRVCLE